MAIQTSKPTQNHLIFLKFQMLLTQQVNASTVTCSFSFSVIALEASGKRGAAPAPDVSDVALTSGCLRQTDGRMATLTNRVYDTQKGAFNCLLRTTSL